MYTTFEVFHSACIWRVMETLQKYRTWMTDLPERLTHVPISCLAIPGSHDSATANLDQSLGVAVDQSGSIKALGSCCSSIVHRWSRTQSLGISEQLNGGIRYLDFRVATPPGSQEIRAVHGLYGETIDSILREISQFVEANPLEIVIIDFNHFYNMSTSQNHKLLVAISNEFRGLLVPVPNIHMGFRRWSMTLDSLRKTPYRIIVLYHQEEGPGRFPDIWSGHRIESPWPNTNKPETLISFLEDIYMNSRRFSNDELYCWQGVLTPTTGSVLRHPFNSLEKALSETGTAHFTDWLRHQMPGPHQINICLADFVEKSDFIRTVIEMNYKIQSHPIPFSTT